MQYLNKLDEIPKNSTIILFGAGDYGISMYQLLSDQRKDVNVICFIDTYKTKPTCGLATIKPDAIHKYNYDFIIITSHAFTNHISQTLINQQIHNFFALNPIFNSKFITLEQETQRFPTEFKQNKILYAFYDFSVSPYGFDYIFFLYLAEIERIKKNCKKLHPILVPPPEDMLIPVGGKFVDGMSSRLKYTKRNDWWYRNIIVPSSWLMRSCNQITICNSRKEATGIYQLFATHIYPENYTPTHPVEGYSDTLVVNALQKNKNLPSYQATEMGLSFIRQWIDKKGFNQPIVSITLRESPYQGDNDKNSQINEWKKLAEYLTKQGFLPIFIRDTSVAIEGKTATLEKNEFLNECSWNMELRMAFYQLSFVNLFAPNGPGMLCLMNRNTRCLIFSNPDTGDLGTANHFEQAGLAPGEVLPNLGKFQKIILSKDSFEIMRQEFDNLKDLILAENEL